MVIKQFQLVRPVVFDFSLKTFCEFDNMIKQFKNFTKKSGSINPWFSFSDAFRWSEHFFGTSRTSQPHSEKTQLSAAGTQFIQKIAGNAFKWKTVMDGTTFSTALEVGQGLNLPFCIKTCFPYRTKNKNHSTRYQFQASPPTSKCLQLLIGMPAHVDINDMNKTNLQIDASPFVWHLSKEERERIANKSITVGSTFDINHRIHGFEAWLSSILVNGDYKDYYITDDVLTTRETHTDGGKSAFSESNCKILFENIGFETQFPNEKHLSYDLLAVDKRVEYNRTLRVQVKYTTSNLKHHKYRFRVMVRHDTGRNRKDGNARWKPVSHDAFDVLVVYIKANSSDNEDISDFDFLYVIPMQELVDQQIVSSMGSNIKGKTEFTVSPFTTNIDKCKYKHISLNQFLIPVRGVTAEKIQFKVQQIIHSYF